VVEAFHERRQRRTFRILYISLDGFIQRFLLRKKQETPPAPGARVATESAAQPRGEKGQAWKCGVTRLDEQNDHLFKAIRQYQVDHKSGGDGATDGVLAFLELHMEGHLALEEAYLEQVRFPGLAEHRSAHRSFVDQLHSFSARRAAGDSDVSLELPRLLLAWIREHILRDDTEWSEFARANRRRVAKA
jgi:hemerythrin